MHFKEFKNLANSIAKPYDILFSVYVNIEKMRYAAIFFELYNALQLHI